MIEIPANNPAEDYPSNPELSASGKVTRPAISSPEQAYAIAARLEQSNIERNKLSATILRKYNGGQPHDQSALAANLELWRSNAPTGFMSGIVDRITPAPIQAIDSARYLTSAKLSDKDPESEKKSTYFQCEITSSIRSWNGWKDFLASLSQEDVLIGQAAPLNLNPYSPWPKMFHGDEVFFDNGVGQHARTVPCFAAKEDLLIHEFCEFLKDGPEISRDAGWDFDACIEVVNKALPKKAGTVNDENARTWEDAIREGNVGAAHSGAEVVQLYHTLAVEPMSGMVTHFITNREGNHELLLKKEDRFENMSDLLTMFCLQPGNGKYYSSKGIGRMLLNLHISIERTRNSLLDNLFMAGMKIFQVPANSPLSAQLKISHPFMVVSGDGQFIEHDISSNVSDFIEADSQISRWAEQFVGSYISGIRTDESNPNKTATEANIDANRDAQAKTAFLARFWGQFADLISQITRRLCDPETTDEIAKNLQKKLKDPEQGNMSDEEIQKLANAPAAQVVQDLTSQQNQAVIATFQVFRGDPDFDQYKLKARTASAMVNPQFTEDTMLDEQGRLALESEQIRAQILETEGLLSGAPGIPVSPRDNHPIHLKVIFSDLKAAAPKLSHASPEILDHANAQLVHSKAHIEQMKEAGAPPEDTKAFENAQKAFEDLLQQAGEALRDQMIQNQAQEGPQDVAERSPASPTPQPATPTPPPEEKTYGGMSEKVITSWISQYQNLPGPERQKLEQITGLRPTMPIIAPRAGMNGEHIHAVDPRMAPPSIMQRRMAPPPSPAPPVEVPTEPETPVEESTK